MYHLSLDVSECPTQCRYACSLGTVNSVEYAICGGCEDSYALVDHNTKCRGRLQCVLIFTRVCAPTELFEGLWW